MKLQSVWINWITSSNKNKLICALIALVSYAWPVCGILIIYMSSKKCKYDYKVFAEIGVLISIIVFTIRYVIYIL